MLYINLEPPLPNKKEPKPSCTMTEEEVQIATWNVNSVRTRLDQVLSWLEYKRKF